MSKLSDYLGRGIVPISQLTLTETTVISPDNDFMAVVVLVAAGGSGAFATGGNTSINGNHRLHAQGGNAGGVCMQLIRFKAGEDYTFTIPDVTPGVGRGTAASSALAIDGNDGGDTTLASTVSGFSTITAYGGLGGVSWKQLSSSGSDSTDHGYQTQTWGANADLIFPGGYGGAITIAVTQNSNLERALATGGGAVNLGSLPQEILTGGNITLNHADSDLRAATGGGGTMGHGGDAEHTGAGGAVLITGGGSSSGPGVDLLVSGTGFNTSNGGIALPFTPDVLFPLDGAGGNGASSTTNSGGLGGGGGAVSGGTAGNGGTFAGGAGAVGANPITGDVGGNGGWGAGGGGCVSSPNSGYNTSGFSGDGGQGVAFVFTLSDFGRVLA